MIVLAYYKVLVKVQVVRAQRPPNYKVVTEWNMTKKQCEFCNNLHDKSFKHSGFRGWSGLAHRYATFLCSWDLEI